LETAARIGYPVLVRPSYVLGGQNMIIAYNEADIREYMHIILSQGIENPVLIDKYLMGIELEVDAICDGEDILIPGIMEHVERTGVHSGDSIAVYPAQNVDDQMRDIIISHTRDLALALETQGLINIQYLIYQNDLYVIEVNPRSSRTVPYISKVTGIPMVDIALRCMLGEKLKDIGCGTGLHPNSPYVAVKVPVFSFEKLSGLDTHLGPEMKSTGEVLGLAGTFSEALYKGLTAAGYKLKANGGVFISVRDTDLAEIGGVGKKFADLGFRVYATQKSAEVLRKSGVKVTMVNYMGESGVTPVNLILEGKVNYIISTSAKGRDPSRNSVKLRRLAVEHAIPCLTSLDTAGAVADSIASRWNENCTELVDINDLREDRIRLDFIKMHTCGNDYIYFDCLEKFIENPEGLSIKFVDRHYGIGGDGCIVIEPSEIADAKMRMFNRDGSEGKLCGNGARCVAKYLYDSGIVKKQKMTLETASGINHLEVTTREGKVVRVKADMGKVSFAPDKFAFPEVDADRLLSIHAELGGDEYTCNAVTMGNPHCVIFVEDNPALAAAGLDLATLDLEAIGSA
ncbi:MAG: diaminopimelate epimerase, partial [Clostridia bacterium]|nr:diaminopimelate epimerase [Clostridia bacterium]